VNVEASSAPIASFEAKWADAYPEFGLALRFDRSADRQAHAALACLVFEIEHAAFGIREPQPGAVKLQWWAEELTRAGNGKARHPLTQALGARIARESVSTELWLEAIVGALAQRDPEPAADGQALLDQYAQLYAPLARIESAMFGTNMESVTGVLALRRALRETASLATALRDGKLPLPLDLLARHRLARGDLSNAGGARGDALREWFTWLGGELTAWAMLRKTADHETGSALDRSPGVVRATMAAVDGRRAKALGSARDPLASGNDGFGRLSIPVVWFAWRMARRSRA
jgi:15-cis-phytoene synthase